MKIIDYFAGVPVQLRSPISADLVIDRINEAAISPFWPFSTGVVGGVWSQHLRQRYRCSPVEYNAKPVLSGRVVEATDGSCLELRYRAPVWIYGFYLFWYLLLVLFVATLTSGHWTPEVTHDKTLAFLVLGGLAIAPPALHAVGTRSSEKDLNALLDFLSQHAGAKRQCVAPTP